jgi:hypothetical protein
VVNLIEPTQNLKLMYSKCWTTEFEFEFEFESPRAVSYLIGGLAASATGRIL